MVPDIDRYAPHIDAVFGQYRASFGGYNANARPDDPAISPTRFPDQASRHRLPLMIALEKLLRLPELRLSVSDLLDLLEVPALRTRFGIDENDLPTLSRWIEGAGIRWGLTPNSAPGWICPKG